MNYSNQTSGASYGWNSSLDPSFRSRASRELTALWYPEEALSPQNENGVRKVLGKKQRKLRPIPTINRKLWNTVEKVGVWVNVRWVFLVMRLVDAGMRKRNLEFRAVHLRNLENFLCWIAYNSDAVTGCINVSLLCVEIHREIGVSKSTIYLMIKELVIMRVLVDAEWSGCGRMKLNGAAKTKQKVTMRRAHFGNIVKTTYGESGNIDIPRRIQVTG
ncbi:hypothetical protein [Candidatus Enterovibrio escicola]|uniref:hypothetical protein n=1 Tax=Candidatus Enterovibrio escicola TaxID=1927127 RepID=UPI0012383481|nr:hypothetical protein [Candidatus Enterovibrio escacola]